MNTNKWNAPATTERLSFGDLVRKGGGTPDDSKPVLFKDGQHQFHSPGVYAEDPMRSKAAYGDAVDTMYEPIEQEEKFAFGYNDVAVCTTRVMRRMDSGVARSVKANPFTLPAETTVEVGYDPYGVMRYETIPGDWMTIPGLDGKVRVTNRYGEVKVTFQFRRYMQDAINGFLAYIREELATNSIYRGQIITTEYAFVNVAGFDRTQVIYNRAIEEAVKVACTSPILDMDAIIAAGEPPRRKVLFSGPPGTGKTLLFAVMQSLLFDTGNTGVVCPPGSNAETMQLALKIARNYMTTDGIVGLFIEDIEKMAIADRALALENLDGALSKTDRILIAMTTNFPEEIDAAFLRQGRVDDFIEVGLPDEESFTRLIQLKLGARLAPDIDYAKAFLAYEGYTPAWIVGGISKVIRTVIARTHSADDITITTEDLVTAAYMMRRQFELQQQSFNRAPVLPTFDAAFRAALRDELDKQDDVIEGIAEVVGEAVDRQIESRVDGSSISLETETGKEITGVLRTN